MRAVEPGWWSSDFLIRRQLIRERNEAIDRAEREIGWR